MSMQKVSVMVPPLRAVPRGAVWVGDVVVVARSAAMPASARAFRPGSRRSAPGSRSTARRAARRAAAPS